MKRSLVIGAALMAAMMFAGCPEIGEDEAATCTVIFDAAGGTFSGGGTTQSLTVNRGASVGTLPTAPTKPDHAFGDWYTRQRGGGTRFTASTIVSADITVYANLTPILDTLAAIRTYLEAAPGGARADTPVLLPVKLNLADDWTGLLDVIREVGKYVDLDLSRCTIDNMTTTAGEFDHGATTTDTANTGKSMIVSLILPDAATSIKAGSDYPILLTFQYFSALKSVSGSHIATVGDYAFHVCYALTTVNLPVAMSIGEAAFAYCEALTTVNLPEARSIGQAAFSRCAALTTVSLPAARAIGEAAFVDCVALTTVNLPEATTIGEAAFAGCAALTTVDLPVATTIGEDAFYYCYALTTVYLPEARYIGGGAFARCAALKTVSLGRTAPTLGYAMFFQITTAQTVTVKVPSGATGYGTIPATYRAPDTTLSWGNGFRGGGWTDSAAFEESSRINPNITLVIEKY